MRNMSYSVGGQLGYVLAQMGVLSALAHYRGPEEAGEFGLALATTTPIFMLSNLGIRTSLATDVKRRFEFAEYGGLTAVTTVVAVIVSICLGLFLAEQGSTMAIIVIVTLMKAFESFSKMSHGALQQVEQMDKVAISLLSRGFLSLLAFLLLLASGVDTQIAFLAQLSVWAMIAIFYDYPLASKLLTGGLVWPRVSITRLKALISENFSLGAAQGLGALITAVPRLVLARYVGLEAVGIFTVVTYFLQAGTMIIDGASHALVSRFAHLRNQGAATALRATVKRLLIGSTVLSALGLLVVQLFGSQILHILFGPEFATADGLLVLVAMALTAKLFSVVPQCMMHADRRFSSLMVQQIIILLLSFVVLAIFVPHHGYIGAGFAVLMVSLLRLLLLVIAIYRKPRMEGA